MRKLLLLSLTVFAVASLGAKPYKIDVPEQPSPDAPAGRVQGVVAPTKLGDIDLGDRFELKGDVGELFDRVLQAKLQENSIPLLPLPVAPATAAWETTDVGAGQFILQPKIHVSIRKGDDLTLGVAMDYSIHAPGDPAPLVKFGNGAFTDPTTKRDLSGWLVSLVKAHADWAAKCLQGTGSPVDRDGHCSTVAAAIAEHQKKVVVALDLKLQSLEAAGDHAGALMLLADAYRQRTSQVQSDLLFERILATLKRLPARPPLSEDARRAAVQAQSAVTEKRYDDAIRLFDEAISLCPWWPDGFYNIALLSSEQGRLANATVFMKRFVQLMPGTPEARKAQDKIYEWEGKLKK